VKALGVTRFFKSSSSRRWRKPPPAAEVHQTAAGEDLLWPVGTTLLEALESNKVPVTVACRAGVCGCCKTKVVSGKYTVTSTMTLTDAEIAEATCWPAPAIRRAIWYSHKRRSAPVAQRHRAFNTARLLNAGSFPSANAPP
jgi:hypothetical protein